MRDSLHQRLAPIAAALIVAGCATGNTTPVSFDGSTWWNHVKVLADDNMEGRETGSEGLKRAQAYIVGQLKAAGLEPAGTQGFYQPVWFDERTLRERDSSVALVRDGRNEPLTLGED